MTNGAVMAKRQEKSSFSVTCSLLSQYIKEKGSLADLGLGMPNRVLDSDLLGKPETHRPPTTMSLLPGVVVFGDEMKEDTRSMELFPQGSGYGLSKEETKDPEKSQLTIFYGGKVLVFDNFPAEKAKDLMQLASKGQNFASGTTSMVVSSPAAAVVDTHSCLAAAKPPASFPSQAQPYFSDLPIARKASLHRFLEKRKDRISSKAPYKLSNSGGSEDVVVVKEDKNCQAWLGLGSHMLKPGMNSNISR